MSNFKIIDELISNHPFYKTFFQKPYPADVYPEDDSYDLMFGATRGCIIDSHSNTVVKFDVTDQKYCEKEVYNFEKAKEAGLDCYFAAAHYIGTYTTTIEWWDWETVREVVGYEEDDDEEYWEQLIAEYLSDTPKQLITISIPLYEYEKADTCVDLDYSEESYSRVDGDDVFGQNGDVGAHLLDEYGEESFFELELFLSAHDINDLHNGNVGKVNGHTVFIDYAGYIGG